MSTISDPSSPSFAGGALSAPGLGDSQRAILEMLRRRDRATLSDLADGLELAAETLRQHLRALAARGLVERAGKQRQGAGRPRVLYRLSEAGVDLFPQREGALLGELADFLTESGHGDLLEAFFTARGKERRLRLGRRVAGLTGPDRLAEVSRILSEEGFMAEVEEGAAGPCLRLCHCPLRHLVAVSREPCRAELGLVRELLGEDLRRVSFMPEGDDTCTYRIGDGRAPGARAGTPSSSP